MPARNHVGVKMEDILAGGLTRAVPDIHPFGSKRRLHQRTHSMHHPGDMAMQALGDRPDVPRMLSRDDQRVSA